MDYKFQHFAIKEHLPHCTAHVSKKEHMWYGFQSIMEEVFYSDGVFTLLTCCRCQKGEFGQYVRDCEFMESLIKEIHKKHENIDWYDVERGYSFDMVEKLRVKNIHDCFVHEVNYRYSDNAAKQYAIVTKKSYKEYFLIDNEKLHKAFLEGDKYLEDNGFEELRPNLKDLYESNTCIVNDNLFTVDSLKKLTNILKNNVKSKKKNHAKAS